MTSANGWRAGCAAGPGCNTAPRRHPHSEHCRACRKPPPAPRWPPVPPARCSWPPRPPSPHPDRPCRSAAAHTAPPTSPPPAWRPALPPPLSPPPPAAAPPAVRPPPPPPRPPPPPPHPHRQRPPPADRGTDDRSSTGHAAMFDSHQTFATTAPYSWFTL